MATTKESEAKTLEAYIKESGIRIGFIAKKLGISHQAFNLKRRGLVSFKAAEVYVLCDLLRITDEDKEKIFLP